MFYAANSKTISMRCEATINNNVCPANGSALASEKKSKSNSNNVEEFSPEARSVNNNKIDTDAYD
jgi:hypothetical protein